MRFVKNKAVFALLSYLFVCPFAAAASDNLPASPAAPPSQRAVNPSNILLDAPQRTFLVAEPIHVFVGLKNDSDTPAVVAALHSSVSLEIKTPSGKPSGSGLNVCDEQPTVIAPHETLWVHFDLGYYSNLHLPGKYTMTARLSGTTATIKNGIVTSASAGSGTELRSQTIELTLVEPNGDDKPALDWIRARAASEARGIESDSHREVVLTRYNSILSFNVHTIAEVFPNSVLGKHAQYALTESRYRDATMRQEVDKAALETALLSYRSLADDMPNSALALLARIGEWKCLTLLEKTAEPSLVLLRSGFAEQEMSSFATSLRRRRYFPMENEWGKLHRFPVVNEWGKFSFQ